jgi:hypothetical protein
MANAPTDEAPSARSGPITDLALTLPIFVGYHLGVVFLPIRNAADVVTRELQLVANFNLWAYLALTLAIGAGYVTPLLLAGRGHHLKFEKFVWMGTEGVVYALLMRLIAGYAVARLAAALATQDWSVLGLMNTAPALSASVEAAGSSVAISERLAGAIMSLGAGFYEELVFRVGIYGAGAALLLFLFNITSAATQVLYRVGWAILSACIFSGWHYVGELGDTFDLATFVFRGICGLVFTLIYQYRGFAPAVWTHALYDIWVLAF